jgi:Gti1/Pac2 family transcription factor
VIPAHSLALPLRSLRGMQRPTLQGVRIRSTRDAHQVFYAAARHIVPFITRRLDAEERRAIIPGNVYVWEERASTSEMTGLGMERW